MYLGIRTKRQVREAREKAATKPLRKEEAAGEKRWSWLRQQGDCLGGGEKTGRAENNLNRGEQEVG